MIDRLIRSKGLYPFIFLVYSIGLWKLSVPLTGDQKVYLSIALEMRERAEWIVPYLFSQANFLKPPLQYWATLVGWNLFGFNLFGALVPSLLALIGSAFLVKRLFTQIFPEQAEQSSLSALLFAGTLGTMTYGTTAQMEIWIVLFYLFSWDQWLSGKWWTTFIAVGAMAWIKGPLYPVLFVLSTWIWIALEKRSEIFKRPKYWAAVALGVVLGLTWYALVARTHFQEIKDVFLMRENVGKMQTPQGTPLKLWGEFLYSLFPPLFWLVGLAIVWVKTKKTKIQLRTPVSHFLLAYGLLPALFFTLFPYRVGTYLYILTPLVAWTLARFARVEIARSLTALIYFWVLILSFLILRLMQGNWIGLELGVPLVLCLVLWAYGFQKSNLQIVALMGLLIVNLIRVGAVQLGERDVMGLRAYVNQAPGKPLAYVIEDQDIWHEFGYISSALGEDVQRISQSHAQNFLSSGGSIILLEDQKLMGIAPEQLSCSPWVRLKRRTKFPIRKLLEEGLSAEDPSLLRVLTICRAG